ncbi:putative N-terminal acetyltransferase complex subunit ARD1 [Atractiella rhizophila]|nr:putative N-terminal acetyltransferase complex subunit ARD1 [Atractiella rhizophila]
MDIRPATIADLQGTQECNLHNLPENYQLLLYIFHTVSWPALSYVATDERGRIVGYILAKIEDEAAGSSPHGHVTSISVLRSYRRLGLAKKLMERSQKEMHRVYNAEYVSLHVRKTNRAALALYQDALGYTLHNIEKGYYGDGEDALEMRMKL